MLTKPAGSLSEDVTGRVGLPAESWVSPSSMAPSPRTLASFLSSRPGPAPPPPAWSLRAEWLYSNGFMQA